MSSRLSYWNAQIAIYRRASAARTIPCHEAGNLINSQQAMTWGWSKVTLNYTTRQSLIPLRKQILFLYLSASIVSAAKSKTSARDPSYAQKQNSTQALRRVKHPCSFKTSTCIHRAKVGTQDQLRGIGLWRTSRSLCNKGCLRGGLRRRQTEGAASIPASLTETQAYSTPG
ncbi:hypothetical protein BDW75DRAFT_3824 [Aspergillus navahoensis]